MRCYLFALLFLISGCAGAEDIQNPRPAILSYPQRTLSDWSTQNAELEARSDLKLGTPKIYMSGTIGVSATGLTWSEAQKLRHLPFANAGMGCIITSRENEILRNAQAVYAATYNRVIATRLLAGTALYPLQSIVPDIH